MFRFLPNALVIGVVFFGVVKHLFSLQVTPLRTIIEVDRGQTTSGSITLTNDKQTPVNVEISLQDKASDEGKVETEWLTLNQDIIFVEAEQSELLEYQVSIPNTATGEYYARIAFLEKPVDTKDASVSILTKISVPFIASVKGTEIYDYDVVDFRVDSNTVNVTIYNKGNVHIRPSGNCFIKSLEDNQVVKTIKLNHDSRSVLPGVKQPFKIKFEEELMPGKYLGELQVALFPQSKEFTSKSFGFEINNASLD